MTGGWAVVGVDLVGLIGHSVGCLVLSLVLLFLFDKQLIGLDSYGPNALQKTSTILNAILTITLSNIHGDSGSVNMNYTNAVCLAGERNNFDTPRCATLRNWIFWVPRLCIINISLEFSNLCWACHHPTRITWGWRKAVASVK